MFLRRLKSVCLSMLPPGACRSVLVRIFCAIIGPKETLPMQRAVHKTPGTPCEAADPYARKADHFLTVSRYAGFPLAPNAKILDFGCGAGALVRFLVARGYDAHGYDINDYRDAQSRALNERFTFFAHGGHREGGYVIDWNSFVLPYPDGGFDAIFTSQVLEHVMGDGHNHVFREFARVMKQDAVAINLLHPRNVMLEPHIRVPFGHRIHSKAYYRVMAQLGFRKSRDLAPHAIAEANYRYVRDCLNYLPNRQLTDTALRYFRYARIDQSALFYGAELSPAFHAFLSHFYPIICFVMAEKRERQRLLT